jgi:hypothetical protein
MALRRIRVQLNLALLTDVQRHAIAASVAKFAPSAALYTSNPSIQASVGSLAKKDAALASSNTAVENDKKQLKADTDVEATARLAYDAELHNLATLAGNSATSPGDITALSLTPLVPAPKPLGPPPVPDGIDVKTPKKGRGKTTIAVQQPPRVHWQYVVMVSPNPSTATSWVLSVGTGKTRVLTGASGTQLWVKAARVLRGVQSDFCTEVLITIP